MKKKKGFQKEAVIRYVTAPATVIGDIGDLLSERHALERNKKGITIERFCLNPVQHHPILSVTGLAIKRRLEH